MLIGTQSKTLLKANNLTSWKIFSRNIDPVCGPPSNPLTTAQKILFGGGSLLLMMVIPIIGLLSLPSWAVKHKNLGRARKDEPSDGVPPN